MRSVPASTATQAPFTLAAVAGMPGWRAALRWPVPYPELRALQSGLTGPMLDWALGATDERARLTALLAVLRAGWAVREAGFFAWHRSAAQAQNIDLIGLPSDAGAPAARSTRVASSRFDHAASWPALRRVARTASLNPGARALARAMLRPDAVAITHNGLLREAARRSGKAIRFSHAEIIAAEANRRGRADPDRVSALAEALAAFVERFPLPGDCAARIRQHVRARVGDVVEQSDRVLDGLRGMRLPTNVWMGSAGNFSARAIALEARRRGSAVTVFDHGGSGAFIDEPDLLDMIDHTIASRMVYPTPQARDLLGAGVRSTGRPACNFDAACGDPVFRRAAALSRRGPPNARPRVLYAPTRFNAGLQNLPPLPADPVYLHHHFNIIEAFANSPAQIVVKPHPENVLGGLPHPLAGAAEIDERPFLQALADADVVISDYPQSTSFWESCCSDRRVVVLDLGIVRFHPAARTVVERRCAVVPMRWNEHCLPEFDAAELRDAALGGAGGDPSAMRALLAGETP